MSTGEKQERYKCEKASIQQSQGAEESDEVQESAN